MQYGFVKMADGTQRKVSKLILGAGPFGGGMSEDKAFELMDRFAEKGGNAIDTARVYCEWLENGKDASERTVGKWIRSRGMEKEIFLITKGAHPRLNTMNISRLAPEDIHGDIDRSLEVLGLDHIDLYFLHRDDVNRTVQNIMDTMDELVKAGQALAIGGSNWHVSRLMEANDYARRTGKAPFTASQIQWSYVDFTNAVSDKTLVGMDDIEMAGYEKMDDMAVMAFSSQSGGVFSKGYKADLSDVLPRHKAFATDENRRRYQALLDRCAKEAGMTPSKVVLEHVTKCPTLNGFALIGCSSMDQLNQSLDAID